MKYNLILDEEQARIVAKACEFYARVKVGQFGEIVSLCTNYYYDGYREDTEEAWLNLRKLIYPDLHGIGHSYGIGKFEDADKAFDVYQVLRKKWGDEREPFSYYELPICETIEDDII